MITTCHTWVFKMFKLTKIKGNEKFSFLVTLVTFSVVSSHKLLMATISNSVDTEYFYQLLQKVLMDYTAPNDEILVEIPTFWN